MTHAVRIHETGGPEVLRWDAIDVPDPGPGQAVIRQTAAGLNFIDVYFRTGLYPAPSFPATIGNEGAGVVEAVGDGVSEVAVGDRVAYCMNLGSYAQRRVIAANQLVRIPDGISDQQAAAVLLKGSTVQYLVRRTYAVQRGDTVLFHAAAGGCGLIACQWLKHLGAKVIGTVGTRAKAELARAHGCDHPIVYTEESFVDRVRELTGGAGVPVVYDSVGKDTFEDSLRCLRPRGLMVSFGNASGAVEPFRPAVLAAKGSLYLTRPTLATYTATREDLVATTSEVFDVVGQGVVKIEINQTYPLRDAAQAHRDLEARRTTGSTVLLPED
ncbi:MAG: quinone oxidoreductase [Acidobacteria bacterium]|nr:quinone oxidoreductase [Acidobacteriota bacterium]